MPRWSAGPSDRAVRATGVVALVALLSVALPGSAFAQDPEDTPPLIANVTPPPTPGLTWRRGHIAADVPDDVGAPMVYAECRTPAATPSSVQLFPSQIQPSGAITYSGSIVLGPNHSDHPVSYSVSCRRRTETVAPTTRRGGEITVDAQPEFDEPPMVSDASVDPASWAAAAARDVGVSAYDLRGIREVYATITPAAGATTTCRWKASARRATKAS